MRIVSFRGLVLAGVALLAVAFACALAAASALAQTAYAPSQAGITVFDPGTMLATGTPIATGSAPERVAITPDGGRAYVTSFGGEKVYVVDTASNSVVAEVEAVALPYAIAVSPDGKTVYVSENGGNRLGTISTQTNKAFGTPIAVGGGSTGLALTPDGSKLYVAQYNEDRVLVVDTATRTVGLSPIVVGDGPEALAVTPDGSKLLVADYVSGDVRVIDTATDAVLGEPIDVGIFPDAIAISPDGKTAYVAHEGSGDVYTIDVATAEVVGEPIEVGGSLRAIALTADGSRALANSGEEKTVSAIDTASRALVGAPLGLGTEPAGIALTPAQTPVAAFGVGPAIAGSPVAFDAKASTDAHGSIVKYEWSFGDGGTASSAGPTVSHAYAAPGTYTVTLTVDNGLGCSGFVFTGQTALCAGPSRASTSQQVTVSKPTPKVQVRVKCPASAKPGGCRFSLQALSAKPKRLRNGKLSRPKTESPVAHAKLKAGKSALVTIRPKPKYAKKLEQAVKAVFKQTRKIAGKSTVSYPSLKLIH